MDRPGAWVVIAIGVFIVWLARGRKKKEARGVIFVPFAGAPARKRNNPLGLVIAIALFIAVWYVGTHWLPAHPLPPVR
jgi:hypothetical protein